MVRLLDSELLNPEHRTFMGYEAKKVADLALTCTAFAAVATIPAIFLHASEYSAYQSAGDILGSLIWFMFLAETLLMVRLHQGWGWDWLRTHKLQLTVVVLANPFLVWAIGRFHVLELSTLLPVPAFVQSAKIMKILKFSKILKFLHLTEVMTKVRVTLSHITWLVNSVWLATGILALGIVGAVLEGGAVTPVHALDIWFEVGQSMFSSFQRLMLATVPLFACAILVAVVGRRRKAVEI